MVPEIITDRGENIGVVLSENSENWSDSETLPKNYTFIHESRIL